MDQQSLEIQAAAFRRLLAHFQQHTELQNIDLMIHAGFCRNCLAKWYAESARELGVSVSDEASRTLVYGMPYAEWKQRFQQEATPEQLAAYEAKQKLKSES